MSEAWKDKLNMTNGDKIDEMLIEYWLYMLDEGFVMNMKMWLDGDMVSDWHDNELRVELLIWLAGWDDSMGN